MILEHEIPNGSKLYFGESAKVKRRIENIASEILDADGYEEIVTPIFSYHQHLASRMRKNLSASMMQKTTHSHSVQTLL